MIAPGGVVRVFSASIDRSVRSVAFIGAARFALAWREPIGANIFLGKIIDRQDVGLADELDVFAVRDGFTVEHNAHVAWTLPHVNPVTGIAVYRHTLLDDIALHCAPLVKFR